MPSEPDPDPTRCPRCGASLSDRALARLEAEGKGALQGDRFARLRPFLTGGRSDATYAGIAREWGVGESAVRVAVHRLRKRFGEVLREEMRFTAAERHCSLCKDDQAPPFPGTGAGPRRCPRCGASLTEGSPGGLCPSCLLKLALEGEPTLPAEKS
jgi:uncharacterized paraquat-inducible protein A